VAVLLELIPEPLMNDGRARIAVIRRKGKMDRLRSYRVIIDGERVGSLRPGEQKTFEVTPGRHQIEVALDWTRSPAVVLSVGPSESAVLECVSQDKVLRGVFYLYFKPDQYLRLRRTNDTMGGHKPPIPVDPNQ
jgi:hypothetical protein